MTNQKMLTVREWVRRWVHRHFLDSDPMDETREELVENIMSQVPYRDGHPCDDPARELLEEKLQQPPVPLVDLVRREVSELVNEEFASLIAPLYATRITKTWAYPETGEAQIPGAYAKFIQRQIQEDYERGLVDEWIDLYEKGRLDSMLPDLSGYD
ncbi:hypothetical protein [Salinibacter ruber]|nr:hypothetical protein [Salinibacter ruber]